MKLNLHYIFSVFLILCLGFSCKKTEEANVLNQFNATNYVFRQIMVCECMSILAEIEVKNSKIVKVTNFKTKEIMTGDFTKMYKSIPQLLHLIDSISQTNPYQMRVEYDEEYHYPKVIFVDRNPSWADDEFGYMTDSLIIK